MSGQRPDEPAASGQAQGPSDTTTSKTEPSRETSSMSHDSTNGTPQFSDPLADPVSAPDPDPATGPDATTTIPAATTRALPTPSPFRVEPSAPVPDDAVTDATQPPHPSPAPAGAQQTYQHDPRPALVTVRKGPRPGSIMFGLLTMIVAAYLLVANVSDADLTFRLVGPPLIGAFGGMLLVVGLAGVVAGRLRR